MARAIALSLVLLGAGGARVVALCVNLLCDTEPEQCCCPEEGPPQRNCCQVTQSSGSALVLEASGPQSPRATEEPSLPPRPCNVDAIRFAPGPRVEGAEVFSRPLTLRI